MGTEVRLPDAVVGGVDNAVAVAVSGQRDSGLAHRVTPHGVVGSIDDAIAVVVARQKGRGDGELQFVELRRGRGACDANVVLSGGRQRQVRADFRLTGRRVIGQRELRCAIGAVDGQRQIALGAGIERRLAAALGRLGICAARGMSFALSRVGPVTLKE